MDEFVWKYERDIDSIIVKVNLQYNFGKDLKTRQFYYLLIFIYIKSRTIYYI